MQAGCWEASLAGANCLPPPGNLGGKTASWLVGRAEAGTVPRVNHMGDSIPVPGDI